MRDGTVIGRDPNLVARLMGAIIQVHLSDWLEHGMHPETDIIRSEVRDQLIRAFTTSARGGCDPRGNPACTPPQERGRER